MPLSVLESGVWSGVHRRTGPGAHRIRGHGTARADAHQDP